MTVERATIKFAAAGLTGLIGPTTGVSIPAVSQALDLFNAIGDRRRRAAARDLCQAAAAEIDALWRLYTDDGVAGAFESALATCTETLERYTLDSSAFLKLGLDPEKAADRVLEEARFNSLDGASIPRAARRILVCFYAQVRQEKELLEEVLPDVYGVVVAIEAAQQRIERKQDDALAYLKELAAKNKVIESLSASLEAATRALARDAEAAPEEPGLERALALLSEGKTAEAEAHFREVAERKAKSGREQLAAGAEQIKEAAAAERHLGALASLRSVTDALAAYRRAAELEPDDTWTWIFISRLERAAGRLEAAKQAADEALRCARLHGDVRDENVALGTLGDLAVAAGKLAEAVGHFEANNALFQSLADQEPENSARQRDLSVSWERIGDVRVAQGDLSGALEAFEASHAIFEKLAAADPGNAAWQRDLSVSWNKIGGVRVAQGDLSGALEAFVIGKAIRDKLAAADPGNAAWQRDLSVSWVKIGNVRVAQGDLSGALEAFEASHAIAEKLAAADPGNAEWQRDLIVSHVKLSEIAASTDDARRHLTAALEIARALEASSRLAPVDAFIPGMLEERLANLK